MTASWIPASAAAVLSMASATHDSAAATAVPVRPVVANSLSWQEIQSSRSGDGVRLARLKRRTQMLERLLAEQWSAGASPLLASVGDNGSLANFLYSDWNGGASLTEWQQPGSSRVHTSTVGFWRMASVDGDAWWLDQAQENTVEVTEITSELLSLNEQWAGRVAVAPSLTVCEDIAQTLRAIGSRVRTPEIEVDDGDGSVALLWGNEDETFALTFLGDGRVFGTIEPRTVDYTPWVLPVNDPARLCGQLNKNRVALHLL
jgi:hypothetical protein